MVTVGIRGIFNSAADQRESCAMSFCSEFRRSHTEAAICIMGVLHTAVRMRVTLT